MNNDTFFKTIFQKGKAVKMSKEDKASTKSHLLSYMQEHPARFSAAVRHDTKAERLFGVSKKHKKLMVAIVAALLILTGGVGTSFAAESSLPGDVLYPIKVNLTENIREVLAFSEAEKAEWVTERLERRLEEIETLAVRGTLNEKVIAKAEDRLEKHAEKAAKIVEKFQTKAEIEAAADIQSDLEASLGAHEELLEKVWKKRGAQKDNIGRVIANVKMKKERIEKVRLELENEVLTNSGPGVERAAQGKRRAAQNKIAEVTSFVEKKQNKVREEATQAALERLEEAEEAFADGVEALEVSNYREAFALFQQAKRIAQGAKLIIQAGFQFDDDEEEDDQDDGDSGEAGEDENDEGEGDSDEEGNGSEDEDNDDEDDSEQEDEEGSDEGDDTGENADDEEGEEDHDNEDDEADEGDSGEDSNEEEDGDEGQEDGSDGDDGEDGSDGEDGENGENGDSDENPEDEEGDTGEGEEEDQDDESNEGEEDGNVTETFRNAGRLA